MKLPARRAWREAAAGALYSALLAVLQPLYLARLWQRGRAEPLYRHAIAERFGRYATAPRRGAVWIHAVSLGETRAAAALVDALRAARPELRLLLTHGTATGREAGAALLRDGDAQAWLPYDTPRSVERFFAHFEPAVGVLMETEVWPNLLLAACDRSLPMLLANARLSEKSRRRGRRFAAVLKPAVETLSLVMAQTVGDAARLRSLGATEVVVSGNLKFDMTPDPMQLALGKRWRERLGRPVVLAASTREGEEGPLLDAWQRAIGAGAARGGGPLLLVVPRHPQRFGEVERSIAQTGAAPSRRSGWLDEPTAEARAAAVWLGDSIGEMALYYAVADVALLGGSFEPLGGQNLIEAAACGCPLVMGPHTFNFADAAELSMAAGAAFRAADIDAAVARAVALLGSAERERAAQKAVAFAAEHRGAAARMAELILRRTR